MIVKIIKKICLLVIFLSFLTLFNFYTTKAATLETSIIYVYINGRSAITCTGKEFVELDANEFHSSGWPVRWIDNANTENMTFEAASYDLSANNIIDSFDLFFDSWYNGLYDHTDGTYSTSVYLWFKNLDNDDPYGGFADLTFVMNYNGRNYETIKQKWKCSNVFTYEHFPKKFWNNDDNDYDLCVGGSWFIYPTSNLCDEEYEAFLFSGEEYIFEYWINPYFDGIGEKYLENIEIPDVFYADEYYINIPNYIGNAEYMIPITWEWSTSASADIMLSNGSVFTGSASDYIDFNYGSYNFRTLEKKADFLTSFSITLYAYIEISEIEYSREFNILVEPKGGHLETPVLVKEIINENTFLSWNKIKKADYYEILYEYEDSYITLATLNANVTRYKLPGTLEETDVYEIYVKACSSKPDFYKDSFRSNSIIYQLTNPIERLDTPELSLEKNILKWNNVYGAWGYELYCNDELIKIFPSNITQYDLYTLNLEEGNYSFRILALSGNYDEYFDSLYSSKVFYEEKVKSIVFCYNNEKIKSINKNLLSGVTDSKLKESLDKAIPSELNLSTGIGIVRNYYLDKDLTQLISKEDIFDYWKKNNFSYLELHIDVVQPLIYDGPTLIYKNPNANLSTDNIINIVDSYCKLGTNQKYRLNIVEDGYTGNGDKPGTYVIKFECVVDNYITNIILSVEVTSAVKADYIYNNRWFSEKIISKEDIILTGKTVGVLPDVTLNGFEIVTFHNQSKVDYYGSNPNYGPYNFMIKYESNSGAAGIVQFEVNYKEVYNYTGVEQKSEISIIEIIFYIVIFLVCVLSIVFIIKNNNRKKKYKNRRVFK